MDSLRGLSCLLTLLLTWAIMSGTLAGAIPKSEEVDENEVLKPPEANLPSYMLEAFYYENYRDALPENMYERPRPGNATESSSCNLVSAVPQGLRLAENMWPSGIDVFYTKYTEAYGIPVVASARVPDRALHRACYVLRFLLADRSDLRQEFYKSYGKVAVIGKHEDNTQLPEYSFLPGVYNEQIRGLGATIPVPLASAGEENLLCYEEDKFGKEDTMMHHIGLGIMHLAVDKLYPEVREELNRHYVQAMKGGLWAGSYGRLSADSYLGEGIQSFFEVNGYADPPDGFHNQINKRYKLGQYDVNLFRFVDRMFPCANNFLKRCQSRENEHFQQLRTNCRPTPRKWSVARHALRLSYHPQ